MASSNDLLFGRISGKLGNLVVYQMYGKTVIRTLPTVKRKPATGKLKKSQDDFRLVMEQISKTQKLIRFGFDAEAKNRSAFHTALSVNLKRCRACTEKDLRYWLLLSQGGRAQATGWELYKTNDETLKLSWGIDETEKPLHPTDRLLLFIISKGSNETFMELNPATRSHRQATITLPPEYTTGSYDCFTAFVSAELSPDKKKPTISDSLWVGEI